MPTNVKYEIKAFVISTLDEEMEKVYEMEENMLERNSDLELTLGKVQRKMKKLSINPEHAPILQNGESLGIERGLFSKNPPNIRNSPDVAHIWSDQEIAQLNQTMW